MIRTSNTRLHDFCCPRHAKLSPTALIIYFPLLKYSPPSNTIENLYLESVNRGSFATPSCVLPLLPSCLLACLEECQDTFSVPGLAFVDLG